MPVAWLTSRIQVVTAVDDEEVAGSVHCHVPWPVELGGNRLAAVAAIARTAISIARHGGDHTGGMVDLADTVVAAVGDEDVPGGVQGHASRLVNLGGGRQAAVAAITCGSIAGNSGDYPLGVLTSRIRLLP